MSDRERLDVLPASWSPLPGEEAFELRGWSTHRSRDATEGIPTEWDSLVALEEQRYHRRTDSFAGPNFTGSLPCLTRSIAETF